MSKSNELSLASGLLFALVGLVMGCVAGLVMDMNWLGSGVAIMLGLVLLASVAEVPLISNLADMIKGWIWRNIARLGQAFAGTDPNKPVHFGLRLIFALAFAAGAVGTLLLQQQQG